MEASKISRWWTWLTARSQDRQAQWMKRPSYSRKASPSNEQWWALHPHQCTNLNKTWHLRCWATQSPGLLLPAIRVLTPPNSPLSKAASNTQGAHPTCHHIFHSHPHHYSGLSPPQHLWWVAPIISNNKTVASTHFNFSNTITNSKNKNFNSDYIGWTISRIKTMVIESPLPFSL